MKNHEYKAAILVLTTDNRMVLLVNLSPKPNKLISQEQEAAMREWAIKHKELHIRKAEEPDFDALAIETHGPFENGAIFANKMRQGLLIDPMRVKIKGAYASVDKEVIANAIAYDYPILTPNEIPESVKNMAAIWVEELLYKSRGENEDDITHQLASDIFNYAKLYSNKKYL